MAESIGTKRASAPKAKKPTAETNPAEKRVTKTTPIRILKKERPTRDIGLQMLSRYYMSQADVDLMKRRALRYEGREISDEEAVLALLTEMMRNAEDQQMKSKLMESIAEFQSLLGFDPRPVLAEMHKTDLKIYKEIGFENVTITCQKGACPSCRKMDGMVISIEEALERMPLPHSGCTRSASPRSLPYCRCRYLGEYFG